MSSQRSSHQARGRVPVAAAASRGAVTVEAPAPAPAALRPAPVAGLTVGHVDDPAEHAADVMADAALARLRRASVAAGEGVPQAHRHDGACGHLRRAWSPPAPAAAPRVGAAGGVLDGATSARIQARVGGGSPLPGGVQERMEVAFGRSLDHVRVHDDPEAARLSAAVSAQAFTTGRDIFFGAGRFDPADPAGERVLAHEIAHVLSEPAGIHRLAVKDTQLAGVSLVAEVGADFSANHMAPDLESAKTLSKSVARLARTAKNTVVLGSPDDVRAAIANAPFKNPGPLEVPGLPWVKITSTPDSARKPEDVTAQTVVNGATAIKVKTRLVADDAAKLTTSPTSAPNGPVVLATGIQG